jgi:DNA-binding XRE family transcriptional regulator
MTQRVTQNHIRKHRKKTGLSQREVSLLLGYRNQWQVSRHERSDTMPPLLAALAYEVIFQVPVSIIFSPMHGTAVKTIERNLADFERALTERAGGRPPRGTIAHKLKWLKNRRT